MLNTAKDMYKYFLSGIRKENTVIMTPDEWTEFINPIVIDWVKTKLPTNEFNQKRIDDLEAIHVRTDGVQYNRIYKSGDKVFKIPDGTDYPKYLYGLSAEFIYSSEVQVDNDEEAIQDSITSSFFIERASFGEILRADLRKAIKENSYRKIDNGNIYFELRGNTIYLLSDEDYNYLVLEYYKYPDLIIYSEDGTDVAGSFNGAQNKEIMDMAIINYLSEVLDEQLNTKAQITRSIPQ